MAQQQIDTGSGPGTGTGDALYVCWQKTNSNFGELYTLVGQYGSTLSGISAQIVTISAQATTALQGVQALQPAVQDYGAFKGAITTRVATLEGTATAHASVLADYQSFKATQAQTNAGLQNSIQTCSAQVAEEDTKRQYLNDSLTYQINLQGTTLTSEINAVSTKADNAVSTAQTALDLANSYNQQIVDTNTALTAGDAAVQANVSKQLAALKLGLDVNYNELKVDFDSVTNFVATEPGLRDAAIDLAVTTQATRLDARVDSTLAVVNSAQGDIGTLRARADLSDATLADIRTTLMAGNRPGDCPNLFTSSFAAINSPLPANMAAADNPDGTALRVVGNGLILPQPLRTVEPNRLYKARVVLRRIFDSQDPLGCTVVAGIACYSASDSYLGTTQSMMTRRLVVRDGRVQVEALLSVTRTDSGVLTLLDGTFKVRPYVQLFGADATTDVEVLETVDVTDMGTVSLPLDAIADRVSRIESRQKLDLQALLAETFIDSLVF